MNSLGLLWRGMGEGFGGLAQLRFSIFGRLFREDFTEWLSNTK